MNVIAQVWGLYSQLYGWLWKSRYLVPIGMEMQMEKVARLQFLASRDAKDSALLYIALDRRTMLAGLFKISKDERDRPLVDFMARDFCVSYLHVLLIKDANVVFCMFVLKLLHFVLA